ncbi:MULTISPECIES: hypothetical protein [unclassified Psychrobacter]|nr:hypothetical protein [Psychrobacter sp. FME5]MBE0405540.1 hypothetical protein [Psychrobacter sp. FME6]MBE0445572.1 hypothetical protein [Psychrobacter sp. FME5]MDN5801585.1 hypothetical protein [Psychrobacter sp.]
MKAPSTQSKISAQSIEKEHDLITGSDLPPIYQIKVELDPTNQQQIEVGDDIKGSLCINTSHPIDTQGVYIDLSYDIENHKRLESRRINSVHIPTNGLSAGNHSMEFSIALMDKESNSDIIPISYHGELFDINWSINVRVDIAHGLDIKTKQPLVVISRKARELRQTEPSANLNPSNFIEAFIFAIVFFIILGTMSLLVSSNKNTPWPFYVFIAVFTLLAARILKNAVPRIWQRRKLGQVFIEVSDDQQKEQIKGQINIIPEKSLVLDQVEVILQRIEEVEVFINEKSKLLYFAKDIAPYKIDEAIPLNKLQTTSLSFSLPRATDMTPTFKLKNHQLSWSIKVKVKNHDIAFEGQQAIEITL